ncbi:MAG: ABC transporter substrate-binding protein [Proteobacteria bacterium]|nr:ABC transporter substrate-binding protein [Pseudomonadota bacterium]
MITIKKRFASTAVWGLVFLSILAISPDLPVLAKDTDQNENGWIWTKERPKPSWWRWDETYSVEKPVRGGYFQTASTRYVGLMNPNHWPVNDFASLSRIYDPLIHMEGNYRAIVPWLATRWKFENPRTVLMALRKGVTFQDGSPFNAYSVKYQMDWIMDRKNGTWSRMLLKPVESVEIVDDYTVRWHLKHAWAGFADIFATIPGWILSTKALKGDSAIQKSKRLANRIKVAERKALKAQEKAVKTAAKGGDGAKKAAARARSAGNKLAALKKQLKKARAAAEGAESLDYKAVGSGAFMVEEIRPGNYLKLKRNPDWWFGRSIGKPDMPYLDGHRVTVIPEASVKLANLIAGKLDLLVIDKSQYSQVKDDPNLTVDITPLNFTVYLSFNQKKGPFADIRLRQAVSHAIDRKALIAANEHGFGRVASCFYPDDHYAHNPNLKPVAHNPELVERLLAQAGYPNGLTIRGVLYSDSGSVRFGQIIKTMLKRSNINWDIETLDPVAVADKYRNLEYELGVRIATYITDPDSSITIDHNPDAEGKFKRIENPKVMALIKAARQELDFEKRKKMYWQIEKALYDNFDDAWLYHYTAIIATRKRYRGYNLDMAVEGGAAYMPTHPGWFRNGKRH